MKSAWWVQFSFHTEYKPITIPWKFCPWFLFPGFSIGIFSWQNVVFNPDLRLTGRLRAQTIAKANWLKPWVCWNSLHITGIVWITLLKVQEWGQNPRKNLTYEDLEKCTESVIAWQRKGESQSSTTALSVPWHLCISKMHSWAVGATSGPRDSTASDLS